MSDAKAITNNQVEPKSAAWGRFVDTSHSWMLVGYSFYLLGAVLIAAFTRRSSTDNNALSSAMSMMLTWCVLFPVLLRLQMRVVSLEKRLTESESTRR